MINKLIILLTMLIPAAYSSAQEVIALYKTDIPNAIAGPDREKITVRGSDTSYAQVCVPTLTAYLPSKGIATGTAVIICPGGGYQMLVFSREGIRVAKAFTEHGIAAFVLKYRLPNDSTMEDKAIGPAQDAQRAIELVRIHASEWGINPDKIGIMGFSAGGHLAATASTHYNYAFSENSKSVNLRPDFSLLVYPVISFQDDIAHQGSKESLLGKNPSKEQVDFYSNELQVSKNTPPAFITHAMDDKVVPIENSRRYYRALRANDVNASFKVYEVGGHGYLQTPAFENWFCECLKWLDATIVNK
ncbi:Acetyl esterase/lipase [bacterium A37T11]|nr:Acetyl esterase/lipase [bacterium A37T11]